MSIPFRLQALLTYREHLRDLCRQKLAELLAAEADLVQQRQAVLTRREQMLTELQDLLTRPQVDVDQAAARRYHAGQLAAEAARLAAERERLAAGIAEARQLLVKADQGVKVLEQLADKQRAEARLDLDRRESREREEIWQAARLGTFHS
jgi:flagellar biosynthesis chaperone FliJ